jgi:hypothetical protein
MNSNSREWIRGAHNNGGSDWKPWLERGGDDSVFGARGNVVFIIQSLSPSLGMQKTLISFMKPPSFKVILKTV